MVLKGVLFAKLLLEVWLAAHWERKLKKQDRDSGTQGMGPKPFDLPGGRNPAANFADFAENAVPRHVDSVFVSVSALGSFGSKKGQAGSSQRTQHSSPSCRPCLSSPSERASIDLSCFASLALQRLQSQRCVLICLHEVSDQPAAGPVNPSAATENARHSKVGMPSDETV